MWWRRKAGLLLAGILGSGSMIALLMFTCVHVSSEPVVAQVFHSMPFELNNTPLLVEGLTGYEGAYVEDFTDDEVVDIAALMVRNTGNEMIVNAEITLICEQDRLHFIITYLPAGEGVVALELNRTHWIPQQIISATASCEIGEQVTHLVDIKEVDTGLLEISNLTEYPVNCISVYHKSFVKETNYYLGGITYCTRIDTLHPGQLLLIKPDHYAPEVSRIVWHQIN